MVRSKDKKDGFSVKHSEVMGDVWEALFGDVEQFLRILPEGLESGEIISQGTIKEKNGYILADRRCSLPLLHLIKEMNSKKKLYISSAPLLPGIERKVKLTDIYTWKNGGEGEFAGSIKKVPYHLNFYDPFFLTDKEKYVKDKEYKISLAALAYNIKLFKDYTFSVSNGPFYEMQLEEFLKENPSKTKEDFESPVIRVSGEVFRMFFPSEIVSSFNGVGEVEDIFSCRLFDIPVYVLKVNFGHKGDDDLLVNLYVSSKICKGYIPKKGDVIETVCWLTGYLSGLK